DTVYQRFRRWTKKGVFERIENYLQSQVIETKGVTELAMDSTYIKVHAHGTGAPKKRGTNLSAKAEEATRQRFTWS
ncbi:MAG: hypothetical protein LBT89_06380, partial [Planctomycetaceae bacterium]|nr:hypothetical protein [Planctomycetaceae bacterium]